MNRINTINNLTISLYPSRVFVPPCASQREAGCYSN